jgi:hypothetical protein
MIKILAIVRDTPTIPDVRQASCSVPLLPSELEEGTRDSRLDDEDTERAELPTIEWE